MKIISIVLLAIALTLVLNGSAQSYADPQLDALLQIAIQARDTLHMDILQINNISDEVTNSFQQGSHETDELSKAIDKQDIVSARQHFLSAMKFFKITNDKINSFNTTGGNDKQLISTLQLQSEITRLENVGKILRIITIANNINLDFTPFDQLIEKATQDLDSGDISDASKLVVTANQFLVDTHNSLVTVAKQRTFDNNKDLVIIYSKLQK